MSKKIELKPCPFCGGEAMPDFTFIGKKEEVFEWSMFVLIIWLLIFLMIGGCSHNYIDRTTFDPNGQIILREKVTQAQVLYWSKYKNVVYESNDIELSIGEAESKSDANSIETIAEGIGQYLPF